MESYLQFHKVYSEEQENLIKNEFQRIKDIHYLDHAGATLYSETQLENIFSQLNINVHGNPHAGNISSKSTEDAIDVIRYMTLSHFNTNSEDYSLIFTSGATQSLKIIGEYFTYGSDGIFVYLEDNHTSVLGMREYAKSSKCLKIDDDFMSQMNSPQYGKSLFVYPAQSNFSGKKYPLEWIEMIKNKENWFVLLDAASFVSSNNLDLKKHKVDFVVFSFYKIFGFPTGLGGLIVRNESAVALKKNYFGGGTVHMTLATERIAIPRNILHERFEDGTLPFLNIIAVKQGFETIKRLNLNFNLISQHTFALAQYLFRNLQVLHHRNGRKAVIFYHNSLFENLNEQGGIVNFNLLRPNGEYVGYGEVLHFANLFGIQLRTGCFCNPGACQRFLKYTYQDILKQYEAGHVCGDQKDLIDGQPTGSVRISFGYMSTQEDADKLLEMIKSCFVSQALIKIPNNSEKLKDNIIQKKMVVNNNGAGDDDEDDDDINNNKITLKQLILYPIKSCGAFHVTKKWQLTKTGLKYDRQWMIIDSKGIAITQKHNRKLCLIKPIIDLQNETLRLTFKGKDSVSVPLNGDTEIAKSASLCQSKVCGDNIQGWDCGDDVSEWLSDVLDYPGVKLLKQCDTKMGRSNKSEMDLSLANKAQFLLVNQTSVEWLREKASESFQETLAVTVDRFRPNFVVKFPRPFMENDFQYFVLGETEFKNDGKCTRCQMICIDQSTGEFSKEPLQTLAREFKGKVSFGVYLNQIVNTDKTDKTIFVDCEVIGKK